MKNRKNPAVPLLVAVAICLLLLGSNLAAHANPTDLACGVIVTTITSRTPIDATTVPLGETVRTLATLVNNGKEGRLVRDIRLGFTAECGSFEIHQADKLKIPAGSAISFEVPFTVPSTPSCTGTWTCEVSFRFGSEITSASKSFTVVE